MLARSVKMLELKNAKDCSKMIKRIRADRLNYKFLVGSSTMGVLKYEASLKIKQLGEKIERLGR